MQIRPAGLRVAVVTDGLSHFEAPLFRLLACQESCTLKVFMLRHPDQNRVFDQEYRTSVWWGEDFLSGLESEHCPQPEGMWSAVRAWQPDVVLQYGYGWTGALRMLWHARQARLPVVFRGTITPDLDPRSGWKGRFTRIARNPILRTFDAWHYGGNYSLRVLRSAGIPESKCYRVPYSVNCGVFVSESDRLVGEGLVTSERERLNLPQDSFVILFIGQLSWFKGPDLAVEIFKDFHARHRNSYMIVVGNGAEFESTQALAARYRLCDAIRFVGFQPSRMTVPFYTASDVVLFPSRYETWARSVNEAMLCKRPCLVNRMMPVADDLVVDGENGKVLSRPDPGSYVTALLELTDPTIRQRLGESARRRALEFSYESSLEEAVRCLRETANA
jgi:glycosyltransferase involved in cell wall biosynthesis